MNEKPGFFAGEQVHFDPFINDALAGFRWQRDFAEFLLQEVNTVPVVDFFVNIGKKESQKFREQFFENCFPG